MGQPEMVLFEEMTGL